MDGVAARRLARACHLHRFDDVRQLPESRLVGARCVVVDERAAAVVVLARQERVERNIGVAVQRVAVGERELRAFRHDMDELGIGKRRNVEALQQCELLQRDGTASPRAGLADGDSAVVVRGRRLERCAPRREVVDG